MNILHNLAGRPWKRKWRIYNSSHKARTLLNTLVSALILFEQIFRQPIRHVMFKAHVSKAFSSV